MDGIRYEQAIMREPLVSDAAIKSQGDVPVTVEISAENVKAALPLGTPVPITEALFAETLMTYGFKVTEENKAMLKFMLENGIPLTQENVKRMNQAIKLAGSQEKALFMLQNNMKLTQINSAQLEGFVSGQTKIATQLSNLLATVEQLNDPALATQLKQILSGTPSVPAEKITEQQPAQATFSPQEIKTAAPQNAPVLEAQVPQAPLQNSQTPAIVPQQEQPMQSPQPTQQTQQAPQQPPQISQEQPTTQSALTEAPSPPPKAIIPQATSQTTVQSPTTKTQSVSVSAETPPPNVKLPPNLIFQPKDSTSQKLDNYFNNLREIITQMRQTLAGNNAPEAVRVLQEVRVVETQIDFASQIRNQVFVQLPMSLGEQQTVSLHVYKDSRKPKGGNSDSASALIALDTASLGHFETYVQKNSRAINCQFRLESDEIVQAVRDNIHKLDTLLRDSGYSLDAFSFLPPGEPYTVLDTPKTIENAPDEEILQFNKIV